MNGSSNQLFSKSWQRPGNLAMMASVAAHGVLFAGLALVPATGQQTVRKQLRVVSLLQAQPNQTAQPNQPVDPNAPPPAPGVAGLPLNITTPDGLAELPVTNAPNPAFDPFASSIVELPPPPPQPSFTPANPNSLAALPPRQPTASDDQTPQPSDSGPSLSDEDFQAWLNGTADLPNLPPDPGSTGPLPSPGVSPGPVASNVVPPRPANVGGIDNNIDPGDNNSLASSSIAPPAQTVKRFLAYDYPKDACQDRLEGKAEYRIWVSSQATPVVSDIVLSTESPILDRAVKAAAQKYKIKAEDANKIVVLPFDIKYSQKICAAKEPTVPEPTVEPDLSPSPPASTPKPEEPMDPKPPENNTTPMQPNPISPVVPQPNEPVVNPTQPAPPSPSQPSVQPTLPPPQPAVQPPAAVTPPPSNPVQPAVPLKEPPTSPQPTAPQAAPAPPTDIQSPSVPPATTPTAPSEAPPATDDDPLN